MEDDQQFCLRWNNHQSTLISVFDNLLASETLVDCTLAAEGKHLKAHKVVLSACSPYFASLLKEQYDKHPIFILKDVKYQELRYMMDYMYRGEVNISQDQLAALLKAAESLQIKGLSDNRPSVPKPEQQQHQQHQHPHHRATLPTNVGSVSGVVPKYPGSNYTLEQTKRTRLSGRTMGSIDTSEMDSREGSSSPSRKHRKLRRKSQDNAMNDTLDNSNSSQLLQSNQQQHLQQQQQQQQVVNANVVAGLSGVGAITAAASALAAGSAAGAVLHTGPSLAAAAAAAAAAAVASVGPTSSSAGGGGSSVKKTDSLKATSQADTMNIIDSQTAGGSNMSIVASSSVTDAVSDHHHQHQTLHHHQYQAHHTDTTTGTDNKMNHKQKLQQQQQPSSKDIISTNQSELVIEPKSEYDDEANDEAVEDLTLDEEDMGMDDLDQKAGPSQGGEGSSQGYAPWQQDQSQDDLLLNAQEAQQRDPQVKHDKSEQTDITPEEFELDDCLLESNDIVITQNKDGFVLHVKKLGNITTAKISSQDDDHVATGTTTTAVGEASAPASATITDASNNNIEVHTSQSQISDLHEMTDVKPTFTTLTTSQAIKLPSSECELINLKKIIPSSTTIAATHHPHTTIIQTHELHSTHHHQQQQLHQQQQSSQTHHQEQHQEVIQIQTQQVSQPHHHQQQQQQQHHTNAIHHQQQQEIIVQHQPSHQQQQHQLSHHAQVQSIVTTAAPHQTINLMGLHNVQITEQKPLQSRIKYSRGKIITPSGNVQIVQAHDPIEHDLTEATKYEISEIDLNNPQTSAAIISDLVKYAEIDDIELPDGTKIGIGFAPTEITEQMHAGGSSTSTSAQIIDQGTLQAHHQQSHAQTLQAQIHHIQSSPSTSTSTQHHVQVQQQQSTSTSNTATTTTTDVVQHLQLQEQDDKTTSLEAIIPDTITVHEQPTIKSYTILTARPLKQESSQLGDGGQTTATTYELSLSDSSMGTGDERGDEAKYVCRHCNKKYRWKSTLRRHENVECGGKEPCHPCPYCSYKAKQRGNLGVHVRKHHPDKPQLESKRGRKI